MTRHRQEQENLKPHKKTERAAALNVMLCFHSELEKRNRFDNCRKNHRDGLCCMARFRFYWSPVFPVCILKMNYRFIINHYIHVLLTFSQTERFSEGFVMDAKSRCCVIHSLVELWGLLSPAQKLNTIIPYLTSFLCFL